MMKNIYYVYLYLRAITSKIAEAGTPYYVGKGKDSRAYARNHSVYVPKDRDRIVIIENNMSEEESHALEIKKIAEFGRIDNGTGILRNLTNGGDGTSGRIATEEQRARNSAAIKKHYENPEARAKLSASCNTPEARARNSAIHSTPEARAQNSATRKKYYENPEARAKTSAAIKLAKNTPEARAKISAAMKKLYENPEARAKQSAAMKKHYENPEARAKLSAAKNTPEARARNSAAQKKRYENPEARAKQSAAIKKMWADKKAKTQSTQSTLERFFNMKFNKQWKM